MCVCLHDFVSPQVENVNTEVRRLSRCLSQASLPSSGSVQAHGEMEEQANNTKVALLYNPVVM